MADGIRKTIRRFSLIVFCLENELSMCWFMACMIEKFPFGSVGWCVCDACVVQIFGVSFSWLTRRKARALSGNWPQKTEFWREFEFESKFRGMQKRTKENLVKKDSQKFWEKLKKFNPLLHIHQRNHQYRKHCRIYT